MILQSSPHTCPVLVAVTAALVVSGCGSAVSRSSVDGGYVTAPIEEAYGAQYGDIPDTAEWVEQSGSELPSPIAMAIERSACYGTCPEYTLAFNGSGYGCYYGRKNVEMVGCYKGKLNPEFIQGIASMAKAAGLFQLPPGFFAFTTDESSVFTYLRISDEVILIKNYADAGPPSLWAFEQLVDGLWTRVEWYESETEQCELCVEEILGTGWQDLLSPP